jgi:hypothetical protein
MEIKVTENEAKMMEKTLESYLTVTKEIMKLTGEKEVDQEINGVKNSIYKSLQEIQVGENTILVPEHCVKAVLKQLEMQLDLIQRLLPVAATGRDIFFEWYNDNKKNM